jgi:hypothetical protein
MLDVVRTSGEQDTCSAERRKWQRLPIAVPVFVRGVDAQGKQFIEFASALNISAGGMLVAARRFLPSLTGLLLEIPSAPVPASQLMAGTTRLFKVKALRDMVANHCHYVAFKFTRPLTSKAVRRQDHES